jgi:hypothetical protein
VFSDRFVGYALGERMTAQLAGRNVGVDALRSAMLDAWHNS